MSRPFADEDAFRAVADPVRRRIVELLCVHDRTPTELRRHIRRSGPIVSIHLRTLRSIGIVSQRRQGRSRIYTFNDSRLRIIETWLQKLWASTQTGRDRI